MASAELNPLAEVWKEVPERPGYFVSNLGRVRRGAKLLKPWFNRANGYYYITLGRGWRSSLHRLVCRVFHGPAPEGKGDVAHFDGAKGNNRADNLRWASRSENIADSVRHGTSGLIQYRTDGHIPKRNPNPLRGERAPSAKLSFAKAADIRRRYSEGEKAAALMAEFGVGRSTIHRVLHGTVWV